MENPKNKELNITTEEAAARYKIWSSTHEMKKQSDFDKAFDAVRHLVPDWFLFTSLFVGVFVLGMIMLKVNPLLEPVRKAVIWFFEFCEEFLKKSMTMLKK